MKMSVIFGVLHMMMGVLHKYTNAIYTKRWASLITECIGGTIILMFLFGWMDLLVFAKWLTPIDLQDRGMAQRVPVQAMAENPHGNWTELCPDFGPSPPPAFDCMNCW